MNYLFLLSHESSSVRSFNKHWNWTPYLILFISFSIRNTQFVTMHFTNSEICGRSQKRLMALKILPCTRVSRWCIKVVAYRLDTFYPTQEIWVKMPRDGHSSCSTLTMASPVMCPVGGHVWPVWQCERYQYMWWCGVRPEAASLRQYHTQHALSINHALSTSCLFRLTGGWELLWAIMALCINYGMKDRLLSQLQQDA